MTRRFQTSTLVLAAAALAMALLNWWALNVEVDVSPLAAGAPPAAVAEAPRSEPPPEAPKDGNDLFSEIQARPLFRSNRRPVETGAPDAADQAALSFETGPRPEGVELAGVMREPGQSSRALIRSPSSPTGDWVEIGHTVGGWRLSEIEEDGVVFEASGRKWKAELFPSQEGGRPRPPVSLR